MLKRCMACGIEKDTEVKEIYPYPEDDHITDEPVPPLFEDFPCQMEGDRSDFRVVTVCHHCFHKLDPDMWISQGMWEELKPITPAKDLPKEKA
jgi:hypothetical protein